jgi:hypothetical protein
VSAPSVEVIGELIRIRRGAPWSWKCGEVRIGRIEYMASGGVRIDAQGAIESVAVFRSLLF